MDNNFISRREHDEYVKRMEEEHKRQNARIKDLEDGFKENSALVISVEKMATSMEQMLKEQKDQGKRLKALEERDGEMWRKVIGYIATAVVGIIVGFIFNQIGIN